MGSPRRVNERGPELARERFSPGQLDIRMQGTRKLAQVLDHRGARIDGAFMSRSERLPFLP